MSSDAETLYFVGCTTAYVYPDTGRAMKKILETAGIETMVLEDEPCCGGVLFMIGQSEEANKKVKNIFSQAWSFLIKSQSSKKEAEVKMKIKPLFCMNKTDKPANNPLATKL